MHRIDVLIHRREKAAGQLDRQMRCSSCADGVAASRHETQEEVLESLERLFMKRREGGRGGKSGLPLKQFVRLGHLNVEWPQFSTVSHDELVRTNRNQRAGAFTVTSDEEDIALIGSLQAAGDSIRGIGISPLCHKEKDNVLSPPALAA
jgi:hypothetical protein